MIYNKFIFGLCPVSGMELLKPLEFSKWLRVIRGFFAICNQPLSATPEFMLRGDLWKTPKDGWGLVAGKPNLRLEGWNFQTPPPPTSGEGRGARDGVQSPVANYLINQPCLCNETSIKTQRGRVRVASGLVDTWSFRKSGRPVPLPTCLALCTSSVWLFLSYILF